VNNFTVVRKPTSLRNSPLSPDDPTFHVNHYKDRNLPLPPVEPFRRLVSSPDPLASSNNLQRSLSTAKLREDTMDSFQMQTPPPTRDSSTRREYNNAQQGPAHTPGDTFQGQVATPAGPAPLNIQTPQFQSSYQYPHLQFSPEMFQFPGAGPQTAPAAAHPRYPWEDSPPLGVFGHPGVMNAQQNQFSPNSFAQLGFNDWNNNAPSLPQENAFQQQRSAPMSQATQTTDFWTASGSTQPSTSFSQNSPFVSTTSGVNPNMIFSFSSPLQTINPSSVRPQYTQPLAEIGTRQPYEHQTKESFREKELAKKAQQPHSRTSTSSSLMSIQAAARPGLQRSNTDSGTRRLQNRAIDPQRSTQHLERVPRTASPLKRNSQASLSAIPEAVRPRPRTRLVVDANGHARTEVVPMDEPSMADNRKSFGLWDDDDDDSDEDVLVTSQRNSFAFPSESLKRRPSKHARVDSDSDRYDVSKRPVSSASVNSLASRLETTPFGKRLSGDINYKRFSSGSFGGSIVDNISPSRESSAPEENPTDAQGALKKVMEGRARRQGLRCFVHPPVLKLKNSLRA
jgi:hypothetical protein